MAIYHFSTRIIKSSTGKSAVASAAYISGQKLKNERLGKSFNYTNKEEVVFSEILLPENAPREYEDRQTLWNAVEKNENKSNSRYAREFEIAVPNEWKREEVIPRMREFFQTNFVNEGMAVDWAYHEKEGNHHVHCMCTVRSFNKDGSWSKMRKSEYALDENGNKIPVLDENGNQKVRVRKGKGEEKLWKRIDVINNIWNSRSKLKEWRQNWAEYCNQFLEEDKQIDHRSFEEQGLDIEPTIHEGYAARQMEQKGKTSERCEHNRNVKEKNKLIIQIKKEMMELAKVLVGKVKDIYGKIGRIEGNDGNIKENRSASDDGRKVGNGKPITSTADGGKDRRKQFASGTADERDGRKQSIERTDRFIGRTKLSIDETESRIAELKERIKRKEEELYERFERIKKSRTDRLSRASGIGDTRKGLPAWTEGQNNIGDETNNTDAIIEELRDARRIAESIIADSESSKDNKISERENRDHERERLATERSKEKVRDSREHKPKSR